MRIWDLPPEKLCRAHLLGEHRELHAIWSIITNQKKGYAHHPETRRWYGKLNALYQVHEAIVDEMLIRGYAHHSPLDSTFAIGDAEQTEYVDSIAEQKYILSKKGCSCRI